MHAAIRSVSGNELRKQIAQELSGHVDLAAMISRMCLVTLQTCMLVLARSWPQPCRPMLTMSYNAWWPRSDRMTASHSLMSSCRQGSANRPGRCETVRPASFCVLMCHSSVPGRRGNSPGGCSLLGCQSGQLTSEAVHAVLFRVLMPSLSIESQLSEAVL